MTPEQRAAFEEIFNSPWRGGGKEWAEHIFVLGYTAGAAAQRIADAQTCRDEVEEWEGEDPRAAAAECAKRIESQGKG